MRIWKKTFFIAAFLLTMYQLNAQSIKRQDINVMGSVNMMPGICIRQTIGQSSPTESFNDGSITLRQGFQQPVQLNLKPLQESELVVVAYPNPFYDIVNILINGESELYNVWLTDITGKVISKQLVKADSEVQLALGYLAPGIYMLEIFSENETQTFKIIKNQ